ncbi:MAG: winged helix-turn-helix domain-containing protein [bacterium]
MEKSVEKSVEKIIRAMKENPKITVKELTSLVGLSRRGVEKNIKILQEKGLLCRVGPDKGGHWEVIEE